MTHAELIGLLLTAHAGILGVALVLFYTYSDRTDGFAGFVEGRVHGAGRECAAAWWQNLAAGSIPSSRALGRSLHPCLAPMVKRILNVPSTR